MIFLLLAALAVAALIDGSYATAGVFGVAALFRALTS